MSQIQREIGPASGMTLLLNRTYSLRPANPSVCNLRFRPCQGTDGFPLSLIQREIGPASGMTLLLNRTHSPRLKQTSVGNLSFRPCQGSHNELLMVPLELNSKRDRSRLWNDSSFESNSQPTTRTNKCWQPQLSSMSR